MTIADCIEKLVVAGQISRDTADKAIGLNDRMKAEYSTEAAPAPAEAAAALATAKALREAAAERELYIANKVENYRLGEQRIVQHPYGRAAGLMSILTKDVLRGGQAMRDLPRESPVVTGLNADYLQQRVQAKLFGRFGAGMNAYRPGILSNNREILRGVTNLVKERFGVETGDQTAKAASAGFKAAAEYAEARARRAGKIFEANEDWRLPQPWNSERVMKFSADEFVRDFTKELTENGGGLKLWDKEKNKPAAVADYDTILRRAYSDIRNEGGVAAPFSKQMRTFQFQGGERGADSFLKLQGKYGAGSDVMATLVGHLSHMAREIALQELGIDEGNFAAWMRLVRENPKIPVAPGIEKYNPVRLILPMFQSEAMLRNTFKMVSGRGNPIENVKAAHLLSGLRDLIGAAGLHNLPITIVPSDSVTTLLGAAYNGMAPFKAFDELFHGLTHEEAAHLEINAHAVADYVNNDLRKNEGEINLSGVARKVQTGVVKATGANWWTESIRRSAMTSMSAVLAAHRDATFSRLPSALRDFLDRYGFTVGDWNKIRAAAPVKVGNGARYYLNPEGIEPALYERLLSAIHEQASYMAHQPDARTTAFATRGTARGTMEGELTRSLFQFKQFAIERMTTHMMRILIDGPIENRVMRGLAFTALSMGAGAVSMQAANVLAGKTPLNMHDPKFWAQAFVRGGAGGIYGDVLAAAMEGDRGGADILGQLAGPVPGFAADAARTLAAPVKAEFDQSGKQSRSSKVGEAIGMGRRFEPVPFYGKTAVDRLFWDKLQILLDRDYRGSFRRAEQRARQQGSSYWWRPGEIAPALH